MLIPNQLLLQGRVAVVTGASSGIGRAIAVALAGSGMKLCLIGRREHLLQETLEAIGSLSEATACVVDLAAAEADTIVGEHVTRRYGVCDILVHSAGALHFGPLSEVATDVLDDLYRVNLGTPLTLTRTLLPTLRACHGQIVFVNSSVGVNARANLASYSAFKHAQRGLADALRQEESPHGVRVISVFVGRTATPMQQQLCAAEGVAYTPEKYLDPREVALVVTAAVTTPVSVEVTDVHVRPSKRKPDAHPCSPAR
jgi:NADP-dependent 3-hydroxy acid dehydrogenase YdfG